MSVRGAEPSDFGITFLSRNEGLPSSQVQDVLVADGFVWVATSSGFARFDGTRVDCFGRGDGLSSHGLRALSHDGDGRLLIGTDAGIDVWAQGSIRSALGSRQRWSWGLVDRIVHHPDGRVLVATGSGLLVGSSHGGWERVDHAALAHAAIADVASASDGAVWVTGPHCGLLRSDGNGWTLMDDEKTGLQRIRVMCSATSSSGRVIVGTDNEVVELDDQGRSMRRWSGQAMAPVTALLSQGPTLWVGVDNRLVELAETSDGWELVATFLDGNIVTRMDADSLGNVWAGTESSGLAKINALRSAVSRMDLDVRGSVLSLRTTPRGELLVGSTNGAVSTHGDHAESAAQLSGLAVWDYIVDSSGEPWAATSDGVYGPEPQPVSGKLTRLRSQLSVLDVAARALVERGDGMWVGTLAGLAVIGDAGQREVLTRSGEQLGYVYTLVETSDQSLWIGTLGKGLWVERSGSVEQITGPDLIESGNTYAIVERSNGDMIVIQDNRVVRCRPDHSTQTLFRSEESVAAWGAAVRDDELWLGTSSGLVLFDLATQTVQRQVAPFLGRDGWEFTTSRSLIEGAGGQLLCGTSAGLFRVEPDKLPNLADRPTVSLRAARWAHVDPTQDGETVVVDEGKWTLDVQAWSSWRHDESSLEFRFQLLGFDSDWSSSNRLGEVRYSSLPAGDYTLIGQCFSPLVGWGPSTTLLSIRVSANRNAVERAVAAISGARRKVRRLTSLNVELEQRVRERTIALQESAEELEVLNTDLATLAVTDALTGLHNRRHFDLTLRTEWDRAKRNGTSLGLLIIDIDFFKAYNDEYGHQMGDTCLIDVTTLIRTLTRSSTGHLARYGGEEFTLIAGGANNEDLARIADRIQAGIRSAGIHHPRGIDHIITVSIGGTAVVPTPLQPAQTTSPGDPRSTPSGDAETLLAAADAALYEAKRLGRNRTEITSTP